MPGNAPRPTFREVETTASQAVRANAFLDGYLLPLLKHEGDAGTTLALNADGPDSPGPQSQSPGNGRPTKEPDDNAGFQQEPDDTLDKDAETDEARRSQEHEERKESEPPQPDARLAEEPVVLVVSHGMQLSVLWKCLLKRFAPHAVALGPDVRLRDSRAPGAGIEHLGGWVNTGYLSLRIQPLPAPQPGAQPERKVDPSFGTQSDVLPGGSLASWGLDVLAVNSREHLRGLKRTGGGVGSSRYDEGQKSIDSFFRKKRKG